MMKTPDDHNTETLDGYIRAVEDQELKGVLLKLKNEIRRPDASWESVKAVLNLLLAKDEKALGKILPLILE